MSKFSGMCKNCGVLVIWMGRWVHVLDGDNPLGSTCDTPEKGES